MLATVAVLATTLTVSMAPTYAQKGGGGGGSGGGGHDSGTSHTDSDRGSSKGGKGSPS